MSKSLYIAEKPSVAKEFALALGVRGRGTDGYIESEDTIITWCVGHLVTMSYPEKYDPALKKWSLQTLPFIPQTYRYEVIKSSEKQYKVVSRLLCRKDVDTIYVCTDAGREGEYIYRLVEQMAGVHGKKRLRVWIDSQTKEEILRGIREAKDLSAYDRLGAAAYLRAKEDYLMGINFSRLLTLKYGKSISSFLHTKYTVISVGRVMTCVLGMVVRREREIRGFHRTPFYRILVRVNLTDTAFEAEWKAVEGSAYFSSPLLYKENGFKKREDAEKLLQSLSAIRPAEAVLASVSRKKEKKYPPLLYNLAELQNDCSKIFKISPDETLKIAQELYEKKMITYPRTDARVLSSAVSKEIGKNLKGLTGLAETGRFAQEILEKGSYQKIASTRYVNDKQVTDHYALIPTGQAVRAAQSLPAQKYGVYMLIVRRFLSIFYPPAVYQRTNLDLMIGQEHFFAGFKDLMEEGYLVVAGKPERKTEGKPDVKNVDSSRTREKTTQDKFTEDPYGEGKQEDAAPTTSALLQALSKLRKGRHLPIGDLYIKEGETTPPKRYNSGSMILAMENAGQLIEDEDLRAQIKTCGIGTSATRAEILNKLISIRYLSLNKKTQILTPTQMGEMVYEVVDASIRSLLNPELTASWEKGLNYVAEGSVTDAEYMEKLTKFIVTRTEGVKRLQNDQSLQDKFMDTARYYRNP